MVANSTHTAMRAQNASVTSAQGEILLTLPASQRCTAVAAMSIYTMAYRCIYTIQMWTTQASIFHPESINLLCNWRYKFSFLYRRCSSVEGDVQLHLGSLVINLLTDFCLLPEADQQGRVPATLWEMTRLLQLHQSYSQEFQAIYFKIMIMF